MCVAGVAEPDAGAQPQAGQEPHHQSVPWGAWIERRASLTRGSRVRCRRSGRRIVIPSGWAQRHERRIPRVERAVCTVAGADQPDKVARDDGDLQVSQDHAIELGLPDPGPRHPRHRAGRDDAVVRRVLGQPQAAIGADQSRVVAECSQPGAGGVDEVGFDIDRVDLPVTETVAQQGGVVPSSGPDLQHAVAVAHVERLQHPGHEAGLAGDLSEDTT